MEEEREGEPGEAGRENVALLTVSFLHVDFDPILWKKCETVGKSGMKRGARRLGRSEALRVGSWS